ncbi:MAG: glucose 1-dehydrogenase [Thermoleophilia bacterium]|nr:glucose 1-dehydrogenase [Thermoleophilia bacterium]
MGVLEGKVAIVTGAGAGLGRAIAEELALAGAAIAVAELDGAAGSRAAGELERLGVEARAYATDVSRREQVDATFAAVIRELGQVDILVNNAGISRIGPHTEDVTDEDWSDSLAVMQTGVFYCMRAAGRHMLPRGSGSIVNISSIRGFAPNPGRLAYCAAKAAVIMMTRVTAGEWGPRGVRVNAICPGALRTPMWDADVASGAIDERAYLEHIPARRLGSPAEVGRLAVYLCSDDASYVTGSVLTIDGGLTVIPAA